MMRPGAPGPASGAVILALVVLALGWLLALAFGWW